MRRELQHKLTHCSGRRGRLVAAACLFSLSIGSTVCAQQPYFEPAPADVAGPQPTAGPEPEPVLQFQQSPASQPTASTPLREPAPNTVPTPPSHPPVLPADSSWAQLEKGRQLIREKRPREALRDIEAFICEQPLEPEGYFWQAVAFDNLNETDHALNAYTKAIQQVLKAGMDSAELRMNTGNVLLKQGKTQAAIEQYKRAAVVDPGLGIVQLNLGRALVQTGDSEGALKCFQRCADLHFQPPQLAYYQAKALLLAGRKDDARLQVQNALSKLAAGDEVAKKIKQEFAELLQSQTNAALQPR
jgi:tetratricopeptide (TPR) repeat protein